ncbi:MAG TPA: CARDB domain-containing protein [Bacteroidales bacterium]|nr:CARDB domain-containing protein [Bacteroidales bacterium]
MRKIRTDKADIKSANRIFQKFIAKLHVLLSFLIFIYLLPAYAQSPVIYADTVIGHPGDSIDIAVRASGLPETGAITLFIRFSDTVLNYGRVLNIHPLILQGYPLINKIDSITIAVSWYDVNGVTIGTGKLFDMRFKYNGGTSDISFLTSCEIADIEGNLLSPDVVYLNGRVTPSLSANIMSTVNAICAGQSILLTAQAADGQGNYLYNWSSDPPGFSSAQSAVQVNPTINTVYSVEVRDDLDTVLVSKTITVYSTPPASVANMLPADSSFDISFPVQFSWSPAVNATLYDLYIWKYKETQPNTPVVSDLTQINYMLDGSSLFTFGDTCKWRVAAKNPCAQTQGPIQVFSLKGLPELHVTGISNSQPVAGQPMTISWTVQNDGAWETMPGNIWMDRVWLSPDIDVRIAEQEDILLGQFPNISYLGPGESYVQSKQIQIPANLMGTYFLFVVTDALDACLMSWPPSGPPVPYNPPPYNKAFSHTGSFVNIVPEISDNPPYHDNFFYKEINFPVPPEPDLIVNSIIPPSNAFSGQPVNVTWTVKNTGDGNTIVSSWKDKVFLSSDSVLNTDSAYNLGIFSHTGILNPDSSYTCTKSVIIPPNIFGTFYFYITTDINNQVFEYVYESNNTTKSNPVEVFLTPTADLIVTDIFTPDTISHKDSFVIGWTVKNQGATPPVVNNWKDNIYLSELPYFDNNHAFNLGQKFINLIGLPHDSSYSVTKQISFFQNITGLYYVYISTDINDNVYEYGNENNNMLRSDDPVMIVNPDLVVANIACPLTNNNSQAFDIHWMVKNNGPGKLNNETWTDKIIVSKSPVYQADSVIQIVELHHTLLTLLPGDSISHTQSVLLPDSLSGSYYVYIYTDWSNSIFENGSEYNNVSRSPSSILIDKPDLAVYDINAPAADSGTQTIPVSWKVINTGSGMVQNRNWTDRIMVSHSPVFDPDSVFQITVLNYSADMGSGETASRQVNVSLPDSIKPGTYYVFVYVDGYNQIYENYSETNNIGHSAGTIQILRPDMIVRHLQIPSSANTGDSVSITWVTKNNGTSSVLNKTWHDRVFLSYYSSYYQGANTLLADKGFTGTLHPGDSITSQIMVFIPEGIQGDYYIHVFTDFNDNIDEIYNKNNNVADSIIYLEINAWPDLQVTNIQITDSAMAGQQIPMIITVKNTGTKSIIDKTWIDKAYISPVSDWDPGSSVFLRSFVQSFSLAVDSTYEINTSVNLPGGIGSGIFYIYVFADAEDTVFEHTTEYNNVSKSDPLFINPPPPADITVLSVINSDSAYSGQLISVYWSVKNIAPAGTLSSWYDAVYLSGDSLWNENTDLYLGKRYHYGQLGYEESYSASQSFVIPNGVSGDYYLLVVADYQRVNSDANLSNNSRARSIYGPMITTHISLTPPPDLKVTLFTVPLQAVTGIPFTITWTAQNLGPGVIQNNSWTDKIYLSSDLVINSGDLLIGSKTRMEAIGASQTYTDSLQITLPNNLSGNYVMLIMADAADALYESSETNNSDYSFVVVSQPPPADLVVSTITHPDSVVVGKTTTIQWTLRNTGQNPANGIVKDMVYFSDDPVWDIGDVLFGSFQSGVSLGTDEEILRSVTAKANDLHYGLYYVFVRTDVLNGINETDENNNSTAASEMIFADIRELPLGVTLSDTLNDLENLYFRIPIDYSQNNETMLTTLKADSVSGANEMYLKHDDMPTRIIHDFSSGNPYAGNQDIIVSSLFSGNYYMLLYGSTLTGNQQHIEVKAEILVFQILSLNPVTGGNTGTVTLEITGSKFDPDMEVRLENGSTVIAANDLMYVDYSKVFATFDLTDIQPAVFDLIIEKSNGDTTSLQQGFEVVAGTATQLGVNIIAPPSSRPNRVTSFTIEFANLGNTNIYNPEVTVRSLTASPIALSVDQLVNMHHVLLVPLKEDNGPSGLLRPGVNGSVTIYAKTIAGLGYLVQYK